MASSSPVALALLALAASAASHHKPVCDPTSLGPIDGLQSPHAARARRGSPHGARAPTIFLSHAPTTGSSHLRISSIADSTTAFSHPVRDTVQLLDTFRPRCALKIMLQQCSTMQFGQIFFSIWNQYCASRRPSGSTLASASSTSSYAAIRYYQYNLRFAHHTIHNATSQHTAHPATSTSQHAHNIDNRPLLNPPFHCTSTTSSTTTSTEKITNTTRSDLAIDCTRPCKQLLATIHHNPYTSTSEPATFPTLSPQALNLKPSTSGSYPQALNLKLSISSS